MSETPPIGTGLLTGRMQGGGETLEVRPADLCGGSLGRWARRVSQVSHCLWLGDSTHGNQKVFLILDLIPLS